MGARTHNNIFTLWPGDMLNFRIFKTTTLGSIGQHAATEAGNKVNTNVVLNTGISF